MTGEDSSEPAVDVHDRGASPPIDEYRYATAILDPEGRYVRVNLSFASLHGGSAEELRGRAEQDLVARSVAAALAENDRLALHAPTATVNEEHVFDSVGRRRVVMCRCALLGPRGEPRFVCRMYATTTARDRVLADFRKLLDALDPTSARTRAFDAELLATGGGKAAADVAPALARRDDAVLRLAKIEVDEARAARRQAESLLSQERSAAAERERLAGAHAAQLESVLETERAARATLERRAQAALAHNAKSAEQEDPVARERAEAAIGAEREARRQAEQLIAELNRTRRILEDERSARESLAAEVAAAGARSVAAESAVREEAARLHALLAVEREARERADGRTRAAEAWRAAEHQVHERVEGLGRLLAAERAGRRASRQQAETRARELEAERAAEHTARQQAETRARELEAERAAEHTARQQAETRARELEAERAAAREALEPSLRLRAAVPTAGGRGFTGARAALDCAGSPETVPPEVFRAAPLVPAPSPSLAPVATFGAPAASLGFASRRPRAATAHRPSAPPEGAQFPPLSALLREPVGSWRAPTLGSVLPQALSLIGEDSGWDAATMWQRTQLCRPLTCRAIWTRPDADLGRFESFTWRAKLDLGEPPSGDLDRAGRLTWVADLGEDGATMRERTARSAGLASRVLAPLADGPAIVGALEVFARTARPTDDAAVARLTMAVSMLAPLLLCETRDTERRRWRV